jgi:hypothetical protein
LRRAGDTPVSSRSGFSELTFRELSRGRSNQRKIPLADNTPFLIVELAMEFALSLAG